MADGTNDELIKCPGCELQLPASDLRAQKTHMEAEHADLVRGRLEDAGFEQAADGTWTDTLAGSYDDFCTGNLDVSMERPGPVGGSWSSHGEVRDFVVDVAPSVAARLTKRSSLIDGMRQAGYEVRFTTLDHRNDPTLRIYERYTGIHGQERLGLVDELGRVWHYDAMLVSWVAELPGERLMPFLELTKSEPFIDVDMRRWAR